MKGYINGKEIQFKENETILEVARRNDHFIPTLCEMTDIQHTPGTCRVCLTEIKRHNDPRFYLVSSCDTPMEEGMKIYTRTTRVRENQRLQVEMLLADHDQDCATCVRHGNCELQDVAQFVGLHQTRYHDQAFHENRTRDYSSPAVIRDMSKCIRCYRCVAVCREIQGTDILVMSEKGLDAEIGVRDYSALETSDCVSCGQCTLVCPVGALAEKDDIETVIDYLYDPEIFTVFQFAPATRIALGDEFHLPTGANVQGKMITALNKLGADVVVDTNYTADLVIMEEGHELLDRVKNDKPLPLLTSCSPGWVNFIEKNYPELLDNVSTVRSPQQCMGAVAKTYLAERMKVKPANMRVVSLMPCTAKKEEAQRPEMLRDGVPDVDVVLTTREFARLIKREGLWLPDLEENEIDNSWMGDFSGAGEIFGTTGGVMEAALRTVYFVVKGEELPSIEYEAVRGYESIREAQVDLGGAIGTVKVAVAHGLKAAREIVEKIIAGEAEYHFVEIMGCPGGCMGGGGQPRIKKSFQAFWHERQKAIYKIDKNCKIRQSHNNPLIKKIYKDFLGEPLSHKSHELLHTTYRDRKQVVKHTIKEIWEEIKG
ncbi:MAG: (2Fe-2S)-binding protein [bacterium]|nr:(2Fe-2S)-binding protein [bacterium]